VDLERELAGLAGTFLGDLDFRTLSLLLSTSMIAEILRGQVIGNAGQSRTAVVLDGTVRVFITSPSGRQLTVRHARPGSMIMTTSEIAGRAIDLRFQALTDATLIEFNEQTFDHLRQTDQAFNAALSGEAVRRLEDVYGAFATTVFGSMRERVAAHLLDAAEASPGGGLIAPVTHRDLAEALGSAREVVSRALADLQREGSLGAVRGGVEIKDAQKLMAAAGSWWSPNRALFFDPARGAGAFEDHPHAVLAVDGRGDIVYANEACGRTFGVRARRLIGQPVANLIPLGVRDGFASQLGQWMAKARPGPIGLGRGFHGRRMDGTEFPAEITLLPASSSSGPLVFARVVDVSYREALCSLVGAANEPLQAPAPVTA